MSWSEITKIFVSTNLRTSNCSWAPAQNGTPTRGQVHQWLCLLQVDMVKARGMFGSNWLQCVTHLKYIMLCWFLTTKMRLKNTRNALKNRISQLSPIRIQSNNDKVSMDSMFVTLAYRFGALETWFLLVGAKAT